MQSIQHEVSSAKNNFGALRSILEDYLGHRLSFDELRTRWIAALADNPNLRAAALRLLYTQPLSDHLEDGKILSLKRIAEAAIDDDPEDWTVEMEGHLQNVPSPLSRQSNGRETVKVDRDARKGRATRPPSMFDKHRAQSLSSSLKKGSIETMSPGHTLKQRFVLEELLGGGGGGVVYRARDRNRERAHAVTNEVAIKVLRGDLGTDQRRIDALKREALLTQSLSHPNIVRVYDYYEDGDTRFLTMELLYGDLLKTILYRSRPRALPRKRAFKIIEGMCRGLRHAHANGCVHADFKPGNVLLTQAGEVKILDFGLAYASPSGTRLGERPADSGISAIRANTPAYASCNRLDGGAPVFSDDVYSLSCVIYEMLAGHHPYQRKLATEARDIGLKPDRIDGLTDLQWRTLVAGLRLSTSSTESAPEVHDVLAAFRERATPTSSHRPAAKKVPVERKKSGSWALTAVLVAFLFGAGLVLAMTVLGILPADSRYVVLLSESAVVQSVRSTLGVREVSTNTPDTPRLVESLPEVQSDSSIAEPGSAGAPVRQASESVAIESEAFESKSTVDVAPDSTADLQTQPDGRQPEDVARSSATSEESIAPSIDVPAFQLGSSVYSINEGDAALAVEIIRRGNVSEPTYIKLTTRPGSARASLDFVPLELSLIGFEIGEATKTIFIPIVADAMEEGDELFEIALTTTNAEMILQEPSSATVIIIDDDA